MPVTHPRRAPTGIRPLRPLPSLLRRGVLAAVAFLAPVFAALYFLTIPDGAWPAIVGAQFVVSLVFVLAVVTYKRVSIWVDPTGITERGFFGRLTRLPTADIGSILLVHTYHGGSADTLPQLFLCDAHGNQVIRLRGQFWSIRDMATVCETLDVPLTELGESVTMKELLSLYPGLLYWFERHTGLAAVLFGVIVLVAGSLLYAGLAAIGVT